MSERYTKKDAQRAFDGLMQKLNKKHTKFDKSPSDIGSWYLDYNATYGGAVINEVATTAFGAAWTLTLATVINLERVNW